MSDAECEAVDATGKLLKRLQQFRDVLQALSQFELGRCQREGPQERSHVPFTASDEATPNVPANEMDGRAVARLESSAEPDLVEETWYLLSQVTFLKVYVECLYWRRAPQFYVDEVRRGRKRSGQLLLRYYIPLVDKTTGRTEEKRVSVLAKDLLPTVVNFNHRNVCLLSITTDLMQCWAEDSLRISIYYKSLKRPSQEVEIARCSLPLCKLLVLPFVVDAQLPLEVFAAGVADGSIKVDLSLGSRSMAFTERIEPLRNPTAVINAFTMLDPSSLHRGQKPLTNLKSNVIEHNDLTPVVECHSSTKELRRSPSVESVKQNSLEERQSSSPSLGSAKKSSPKVRFSADLGPNDDNECVECRIDYMLKRRAMEEQPFGLQVRSVGTQTGYGGQCRTVATQTAAPHFRSVASRLAEQAASLESREREGAFPTSVCKIEVHRARYLLATETEAASESAKGPHLWVTYRVGDKVYTSPTSYSASKPVWDWSADVHIGPEQKNLVFQLWYKKAEDAEKQLLGVANVDLSQCRHSCRSTWWFDLLDLKTGSSGQLQISVHFNGQPAITVERNPPPSTSSPASDRSAQNLTPSSAVLADKLKERLAELDVLMAKIATSSP
uniref:C2 domain-containing protein n=1 Tax=Trichuris muris TaxID=70415 RepID=A0A5S6QIT8_TRIMR